MIQHIDRFADHAVDAFEERFFSRFGGKNRPRQYRSVLMMFAIIGMITGTASLIVVGTTTPGIILAIRQIGLASICLVARHFVGRLDEDRPRFGRILKRLYVLGALFFVVSMLRPYFIGRDSGGLFFTLWISIPLIFIGWRGLRNVDREQSPRFDLID